MSQAEAGAGADGRDAVALRGEARAVSIGEAQAAAVLAGAAGREAQHDQLGRVAGKASRSKRVSPTW